MKHEAILIGLMRAGLEVLVKPENIQKDGWITTACLSRSAFYLLYAALWQTTAPDAFAHWLLVGFQQ